MIISPSEILHEDAEYEYRQRGISEFFRDDRRLGIVLSRVWTWRLDVLGRFKRQPHVKLCAIRTRAEVDFSVMPFDDDPVADYQAEPRA